MLGNHDDYHHRNHDDDVGQNNHDEQEDDGGDDCLQNYWIVVDHNFDSALPHIWPRVWCYVCCCNGLA